MHASVHTSVHASVHASMHMSPRNIPFETSVSSPQHAMFVHAAVPARSTSARPGPSVHIGRQEPGSRALLSKRARVAVALAHGKKVVLAQPVPKYY